jgi:hypothetical protein
MSTKTQQTGQFNAQGMNTYNNMQGGFGTAVNSYMSNPFSNPFMQQQQQMGTNQANQTGQTAMSNITRNWNMTGSSGNNPAYMEMINNQARMNSQQRSQLGFQNPMQNAFTAQQNAMGMASQYKPLQTGSTQSQSGLGSWLPQIVGGGLSALTGGLMGGGGSTSQAGGSGMQMPSFGMSGPTGGSYDAQNNSFMQNGGFGGYNQPQPPGGYR